MRSYRKDTAILYFTRSAAEEARVKSFCRGGNFAQNRAIAQQLIDHTFDQIKASGLPVRAITSSSQQGRSFGERFANAFQSLFEEGFENVIAVGNDCIQLSGQDLIEAHRLLQKKSLVAGPAADGGVYLMGISRKAFHKEAFCSLAWETDRLLDDFKYYVRRFNHSLVCLDLAIDIDHERALHQFLHQVASHVLYQRLIKTIQSIISSSFGGFRHRETTIFARQLSASLYHRGPPVR